MSQRFGFRILSLAFATGLLFTACTLDDGSSDPVFTCDASGTVLEYCQEEPALASTKEISKNTCNDVKGTWSETGRCPAFHTKKCKDGDKMAYYYAKDDANKSCSELIGALPYGNSHLAMSWELPVTL